MALTKCCCCVDLLKGVKILGIVLSVLTFLPIIITAISIILTGSGSIIGLCGYGPALLVNLLLVKACHEKSRVWLLPW